MNLLDAKLMMKMTLNLNKEQNNPEQDFEPLGVYFKLNDDRNNLIRKPLKKRRYFIAKYLNYSSERLS